MIRTMTSSVDAALTSFARRPCRTCRRRDEKRCGAVDEWFSIDGATLSFLLNQRNAGVVLQVLLRQLLESAVGLDGRNS